MFEIKFSFRCFAILVITKMCKNTTELNDHCTEANFIESKDEK